MTRSTKGVLCILFPFVTLFTSLALFAIFQYFAMSFGGSSSGFLVFVKIVTTILSLLGLIGVIGFFVFPPIGVYLLITSEEKSS